MAKINILGISGDRKIPDLVDYIIIGNEPNLCNDCDNPECDGWEGKIRPTDFVVRKCKGHFSITKGGC